MRTRIGVLLLLLGCLAASATSQTKIPAPADALGFVPGEDRKLASWSQVVDYFERLDGASDRLTFETLGQTSMNKPFVMATISSPANLARLTEYQQIQDELADPRKLGPLATRDRKAAELIRRGKTIVLITCGIHSTEVGSYLSSMLIAHRLASSTEPEIQKILDNTIILLVPSLNPDGVDIVKNWYDKTLGTPFEGTDPPELYHKYTGHDNNRDWYAFTQVETQLTVDKIHNAWHPQIVHDIHQQGQFGSRLFLPPYMAPVEPNVPKPLVQGYTELGSWMAAQMRAKGFEGITTNSTYDAWTPARAYSHYHSGVRMLSETASAKIASPLTVKFEELRSREGYDPQKESPQFGPVWRGGEWRLSDITKYMTTGAFLLLDHAAQNRELWLRRFYSVGKNAVRPRRPGELFGYLIEPAADCEALLNILRRGGVEIEQPKEGTNFKAGSRTFPAGTKLVRMDQPYGAFAKTMLEVQRYPNLRDATGHPIAPYDVTAHTLPLLMGVTVHPVKTPFRYSRGPSAATLATSDACKPAPRVDIPAIYRSSVPAYDEGWTRWIMDSKSMTYGMLGDKELRAGSTVFKPSPGVTGKYYVILIPDQPARTLLEGQAGIDPERLDELTRPVHLATQRVSEKGSRAEGGAAGMFFALTLFMILYVSMLLWGQQVMNGVLEEKGSRVIEVVISAVTAFELMMGKLVGICLVGLTQLGIWLGTIAVLTAPGIVAATALMPEGSDLPTLSPGILVHFILLFILGFFAFATLYAAIGASFNNLQEAQQAASVAAVFIVLPVMVMWPIINDASSRMATVLSLIPLFTPLLMPLRIVIEMPPAWQLALAYALTLGFVVGMVWFCSKIYRVGILMYGKKPTFKEIWKWTRYA